MHTRSRIHHNTLLLPVLLLTRWEYPFFRGRVECSFVFFFEHVFVFGKVPCLASGTSLLSFSLFMGLVLKSQSVGTSLMRIFDLYFSKRWSFLFPDTCLTQRRLSESYSSNRSQDFLHRVSPGLFSSLRNQCFRVLRDATRLWFNFHNSHSILVVAFSFFCGNSSLSLAFCLVVHQPYDAGTNTYPRLCSPFLFCKIDTRVDANVHKAIACKYLSKNICTVVEEWHHGHFCLGYFSSLTHFVLVTRMARKVSRLWVLVFAHDRYSHAGNVRLPNTGLFLSTGNRNLFSSFNATHSLSILDHCSCFTSPVSGGKIS